MPTISELVVKLTAETASFRSDLKKSTEEVEKMGKSVTGTFSAIKGFAVTAIEAYGASMVGEFIHRTTEGIDQMGKLAQKTGLSTEAISQLAYAAKLSDVPLETFAKGVEKLSKAMVGIEDSPQSKGAGAALHKLGIETVDATGKLRSNEEVMLDVAEKFAHMQNGAEKTGLAMQIFGKAGAELIPMLNQGRVGLSAMREEADKLGITLNEKTVAEAEAFNDNLKRLEVASHGLAIRLVGDLLPALNQVTQNLADTQKLGQYSGAVNGIGLAFKTLAATVVTAIAVIRLPLDLLGDKIRNIGALVILLAERDFKGAKALIQQHIRDTVNHVEDAATEISGVWSATFNKMSESERREKSEATDQHIKNVGVAAKEAATSIDAMWQAYDKLFHPSGDIAELDQKITKLQQDIVNVQAFLEQHPGVFFPDLAKQIEDDNKTIDDLIKKRDKLQEVPTPNVGVLPGGPTIKDIPIIIDQLPKKIEDGTAAWKKFGAEMGEQVKAAALFGRSWKDVFKTFLVDLAQVILQMTVLKGIEASAGGGSGGSSGGGGILGAVLSGLFGKRASGGPVEAGRPYLVGENGPEPFIPGMSGTILPNSALQGGGSGGGRLDVVLRVTSDVDLKIQRAEARAAQTGAALAVNVITERKLRTT
jgi:hypothetical protein